MQKVIQHQTNKLIIALPAIALAIFTALITNIYIGNSIANSHAILGSEEYQLSVQNNTTLSVELPATTPISVTPTVEGAFNSGNVTINVITDYVNGYTLTMSASTSSLSRSEAVSGVTYTIPSLTSSKDATDNPYTCTAETSATCNFPKNYWGLKRSTAKVTDAGYIPYIANTSMLINSTASAADESISNVDFGVKLSNATPNGTYNITLDFLAVTNVAPNLYYMQDATPSSLAAAMPSVGSTTTLYDRRDNQEYTVAKLADGKYWMTKNLNLAGGTPLYSSDSDVPAGYDAEPYYTLPNSSMDGFDNNGATYAYVYNSDNNTDNCDNGCHSYYSYNTATALSGTNIPAYTDAPYSICPKGWKLPTASPDINDNADLYQLAVAYGMNSNAASEVTATFYNNAGAGKTPNVLLSGFVRQSASLNAPSEGDLWSATTGDVSDRALYMRVTGSYVDSAHNDARMYGFAVRCLLK